MKQTLITLTLIGLLSSTAVQAAKISRCELPDGTVSFSDSGCAFGGDKEAEFELSTADKGVRFVNENNVDVLVDAYERDIRRIQNRQRHTAPSRNQDGFSRRLRERELRMQQGQTKGDGSWASELGTSLERRELQRQRHDLWR